MIKTFSNGEVVKCISQSWWDSIYEREMDKVRVWMKAEQAEILTILNQELYTLEYNKYAEGGRLRWELDALNFYHTGHELEGIAAKMPVMISNLNELRENEVIGEFNIKGKIFPKYQLRHIIGTVLDKDKQKHLVTLSTTSGVINMKVYRNQFARFDQVISHVGADGKKIVDEESFFKKGTFLIVTGIKRGDVFMPKAYKSTGVEAILKLDISGDKVKAFQKT